MAMKTEALTKFKALMEEARQLFSKAHNLEVECKFNKAKDLFLQALKMYEEAYKLAKQFNDFKQEEALVQCSICKNAYDNIVKICSNEKRQ